MNKVILADDHGVFRAGTAEVLSIEDDFSIIAQCRNVERLENALEAFRGATVLFSATMEQDPSRLMQQIRSLGSRGIAVLENSESTAPYLSAQVHGLLFRSSTDAVLVDCVRRVGKGERAIHTLDETYAIFGEDLVGTLVRDQLTSKEMKVVALIVRGCKNKEIALSLGITDQVVRHCLLGVYAKIGISDRLELALFIIHHRILHEAARAAGNLIMVTV